MAPVRTAQLSRRREEGSSRRQVNIWLSEDDLQFLRTLALEREQTVSALIRRAVKLWRDDRQAKLQHTKLVSRFDST